MQGTGGLTVGNTCCLPACLFSTTAVTTLLEGSVFASERDFCFSEFLEKIVIRGSLKIYYAMKIFVFPKNL